MLRTHTCNDLRVKDVDKNVVLCGWVHSIRLHGRLCFIDLRDRYGMTQVTANVDDIPEFENLKKEFVIKVSGIVRKKPEANKKLDTGEIEVYASSLEILNTSETLPLDLENYTNVTDETRLRYRYLDLRRPVMKRNIQNRHNATQAAREFLDSENFLEIETPLLVRSTPEGARDYIVPSRVNHGRAYSLPQSPQIYKQILMVAGFDRYYQIARCLRDEDLRADRQPEFTQIDVEMSFVEQEDIFRIGEGLMKNIFQSIGVELKVPFKRFPYDEAMLKYGSDKPDIRFELFLHDISDHVKNSDFSVFTNAIQDGGIVKALCVEYEFARKEIDELSEAAKIFKAKGLIALKVVEDNEKLRLEGSAAKYLSSEIQMNIIRALNAKPMNTILIVADSFKVANDALGNVRKEIGKKLVLYDEKEFAFCWVYDFPLYEWNPEELRWDAAHHIFTMPKYEHLDYLESDPGKVRALCYDIVLNGIELGSGSIRINRRDIQERVMAVIGLTMEDVERKFGFMLEAFKYGAPPHGGFAVGLDRMVALMNGTNDIREVIAFPKNKQGENPMDGCPSPIDENALKELGLRLSKG
ncbi:TPA: aspartate--tRNA ligase [Candidatus Woesearchaeota archaeon]|nr:aspartate--tRNA ligase [Candidatus Woesearchaeota archaeon]HIH31937.1 aspartate--tRNA ligase [Candidatus Woesearchaeota archaeon]HIH55493.1 aspartate--tRNA ligase [Candidatus Woesearchaeota archaeon]HIJ01050.1 aspartate--tRNA ligase [Candidatus Woesearchaeota archaeon]HIJ14725.1 aspartate--tRNA ligase [Candidatus Woesearchaeota archaeon]